MADHAGDGLPRLTDQATQQSDDGVSQAGEHLGAMALSDLTAVLVERGIADPMEAVLDTPVPPVEGQQLPGVGLFRRCPPWRAKRRRVVPGSREATRETRRAEGAKGIPREHPNAASSHMGDRCVAATSLRCCAERRLTRTSGAPMSCRRSIRFWGLGCPKIFHEIEDSLVRGEISDAERSVLCVSCRSWTR